VSLLAIAKATEEEIGEDHPIVLDSNNFNKLVINEKE
jgi:hypothetical protein